MSQMFDFIVRDFGEDHEVVISVREKIAELGATSDEEIDDIIRKALSDKLREIKDSIQSDVEISEKDKACMKKASEVVERYLKEDGTKYTFKQIRDDLLRYEMHYRIKDISLQVNIFIQSKPNVCTMVAYVPITADEVYGYPLCSLLEKINITLRFGTLRYDESDGELTCEYSFLIDKGIVRDDLETYLYSVVIPVVENYDDIKKCCVGRFNDGEKKSILKKVEALVTDITE